MSFEQPSPSAGSWVTRLVASDPDYERILAVASLLGQGLVLRFVREAGASEAEAQRTLVDLTASLPRTEPELTESQAKAFLDLLDAALNQFSDRDDANEAAVHQAVLAFKRQAASQAEVSGFIADTSKLVAALGLAAVLLLAEAKLGAEIPLPGGGHVTIVPGVPDKMQPFLDLVGKAVPTLGTANVAHPQGVGSQPPKASGRPAGSSQHGSPSGTGLPKRSAPASNKTSQRVAAEWMDYAQALEKRDAVLKSIQEKHILSFLTQDDDLFVKQQGKHRDDIWTTMVPARPSVTVSAGVFRAFGERPNDNRVQYRVGLRLQSQRRLTLKAIGRAAAELDKLFPDHVSVRWTTKPIHLASNPEGHWGSWAVPPKGRAIAGSPVNVAGGAVASWALVLNDKKGKTFGLTVGHTVRDDDDRGQNGVKVYSPPQGVLVDPRHVFGSVVNSQVFDAFDPFSMTVGSAKRDFALVELDPGRLPQNAERLMAGARSYVRDLADPVHVREERPRLIKAPAKTREAIGRLIQTNVRAEITNPMTGLTVVGDALVEIELEEPFTINRGDSGALICSDDGKNVKPYAMVVAAVQKACLPTVKAPTRYALYALPLAEIPALNGLEIW